MGLGHQVCGRHPAQVSCYQDVAEVCGLRQEQDDGHLDAVDICDHRSEQVDDHLDAVDICDHRSEQDDGHLDAVDICGHHGEVLVHLHALVVVPDGSRDADPAVVLDGAAAVPAVVPDGAAAVPADIHDAVVAPDGTVAAVVGQAFSPSPKCCLLYGSTPTAALPAEQSY